MADGTKAVVETSVADEAALAMALGDIPGGTPEAEPADTAPEPADTEPDDAGPDDVEPDDVEPTADRTAKEHASDQNAAEDPASDDPVEATAPLSAAEIATELAARAASRSATATEPVTAAPTAPTATATEAEVEPEPEVATLPPVLPAPMRHSGDKVGGRYRLEECITQSEVFSSWRAVDEKLRRAVGVHLLAAGHQRAAAVLAAAKAAALLGDPRFVQVLDAVQEGELVYVVREWLPGAKDLAQLLTDGPMEPYDAYQMARQVTDAIATAHRRGQAHLRLTPRCVLRTESGQYRINGIAVEAALRGLSAEEAELTDTRAIGALLYAALTHRWPYPEDRYDLQGLPRDLGCVPPDQVKAGVHKGLAELAARAVCEHPPHHQEPLTSPEQLAEAITRLPKIRQPEPPELPPYTPPRYPAGRPAQTQHPLGPGHAPGHAPSQAHPQGPVGAEPAAAPHPRPARPGRRRKLHTLLRWTASAVALAAIGVGSWQLVSNLHGSKTDTAPDPGSSVGAGQTPGSSARPVVPAGHPLTVAGIQSFNALGDQPEHAETAGNAIDGKPDTYWQTSSYDSPFGAWKEGTGLLLDLGSTKQVSSVDVQLTGRTGVELRAAPGSATTAPTADKAGLDSLGTAVAKGTGTEVVLKPDHVLNTRYLLIWLTDIPKDEDDKFQGRVAEIKVTG
ncbi:protein kinase family protein [Kitasatospora kazusensis]|uniref:Protein kinase family protein n=1 Tax=Kitasatospora kazusensis TaxID=407974 RepID=A0ABN2YZK5_9ACTN